MFSEGIACHIEAQSRAIEGAMGKGSHTDLSIGILELALEVQELLVGDGAFLYGLYHGGANMKGTKIILWEY
jgi:hypothetical protein